MGNAGGAAKVAKVAKGERSRGHRWRVSPVYMVFLPPTHRKKTGERENAQDAQRHDFAPIDHAIAFLASLAAP
jgi:hypothetical protein